MRCHLVGFGTFKGRALPIHKVVVTALFALMDTPVKELLQDTHHEEPTAHDDLGQGQHSVYVMTKHTWKVAWITYEASYTYHIVDTVAVWTIRTFTGLKFLSQKP